MSLLHGFRRPAYRERNATNRVMLGVMLAAMLCLAKPTPGAKPITIM